MSQQSINHRGDPTTPKPIFYNTLIPFKTIEHLGIQYTVARDFPHVSRYKGLRQVIHAPRDMVRRKMTLETMNPLVTRARFQFYDVPLVEENRLDLIAHKFFGNAQYAWLISYFNNIEDGFTVTQGQRIRIIENYTTLFNKGELLAPVPANIMNLGEE